MSYTPDEKTTDQIGLQRRHEIDHDKAETNNLTSVLDNIGEPGLLYYSVLEITLGLSQKGIHKGDNIFVSFSSNIKMCLFNISKLAYVKRFLIRL